MRRPSWFTDDKVLISAAPTCGINKDGEELYLVDEGTGRRTNVLNDRLCKDVEAVLEGRKTDTVRWVAKATLDKTRVAVPVYYDPRPLKQYRAALKKLWPDFESRSLGDLIDDRVVAIRQGHGSPSADVRSGTIPYIKVSDLRAGQVNINPTNRVSDVVARRYWKSGKSGLRAYDLLTPIRTSKNIGDMSILMPGQEQLVLTKEILVLRPGPRASFDQFYLLWALTLEVVRNQWNRIIFMQTNREDVGARYREIELPIAPDLATAAGVSAPFRAYYEGIARLRNAFLEHLKADDQHYVFLSAEGVATDLKDVEEG